MKDRIFQIAYEASRHSMVEERWQRMETREQAALIYQEMRRIDAGNATVTAQSPNTASGDSFGAGG